MAIRITDHETLKSARTRRESYFAAHDFTGLLDTDTFKFAMRVEPGETMYLHFGALYITALDNDSAYIITSFNGETSAITGGSLPDTDVNEITGDASDRVTIDVNELPNFNVPFNQYIVKNISVAQGANSILELSTEVGLVRDLVNQPIILENITQTNQYILLVGTVDDRFSVPSQPLSVRAGVFYSIVK